ncbi:MAG: hypothetical protein K2X81_20720 [Candidatus Obscuribacterales bacterium]|jgi:Tfp pilus assembly protein PilE|nr:hypothetical protein [Candidatus Obscuribacterales bacterium]
MIKSLKRNQSGITVIELLVMLLVLAIVGGIASANFFGCAFNEELAKEREIQNNPQALVARTKTRQCRAETMSNAIESLTKEISIENTPAFARLREARFLLGQLQEHELDRDWDGIAQNCEKAIQMTKDLQAAWIEETSPVQ